MSDTSVTAPDIPTDESANTQALERLFVIMSRLRDPVCGCAWTLQQTFATIAPYSIEEAYELNDAIDSNDSAAIADELGDLLLQVILLSQIAAEQSLFDFSTVAHRLADKLERRSPHIFATESSAPSTQDAQDIEAMWDSIKTQEKQAKRVSNRDSAEDSHDSRSDSSTLSGVARALPALLRAQKLQKRAAQCGFDWPYSHGARDKIIEELSEVEQADSSQQRCEEIGDLLFAVVNLARHLDIDSEHALRLANDKFEHRYTAMEKATEANGEDFASLALAEKERYWQAAKAAMEHQHRRR